MENELVHHHDFHSIQFQNFNVKERNVIYALCYKVMNQGTDLLEFSVKEIENLANYTPRGKGDNVYKLMEEVYDRVKNASIKIKKENGIKAFVLFTKFETFEDKGIIQIKVNEEYRYLLNELAAPFTIQNIIEYSKLTSGYSQLAYSFLKKWEGRKKIKISIIEFRELLGVPESYDSSDFNKRVLSYLEKELPNYFSNLKIEKIKTGRKVTHLNFDWKNKPTISNKEIINLEISQELQDAFDKALKNRFIKEFLTEDNKHKIINSFDEKDLIRGLKYAKDNINYSFKTFSYLENSIKKGLEKPIIKTTIVKTTIPGEEENILIGEQLSIKTKVTKEQYEECYQEYLKINKAKDSKQIRKSWELSVKNKFEIIEIKTTDEEEIPKIKVCKYGITKEKYELLYQNFLILNDCVDTENTRAGFDLLNKSKYQFVERNVSVPILATDLETLSWKDIAGKKFIVCKNEEELNKNHIIIREGEFSKKIISLSDIPEEKLLSKNGKKLVGGALISRLEKISRDEKIEIDYNGKKIFGYR